MSNGTILYKAEINRMVSKYAHDLVGIERDLAAGIDRENDAQNRLLFTFCQATKMYCEYKAQLNSMNLLPATREELAAQLDMIYACGKHAFEMLQEATPPGKNDLFIQFGKAFYQDDPNISIKNMVTAAQADFRLGRKEIKNDIAAALEQAHSNGKRLTQNELAAAAQLVGQSKALFESCLLPASRLPDEFPAFASQSQEIQLWDARIKGFEKEYHVESKHTSKGHLFTETFGTGADKEKTSPGYATTKCVLLTDGLVGHKLYQTSDSCGIKMSGTKHLGDGKITTEIETSYKPIDAGIQIDPRDRKPRKVISAVAGCLRSVAKGYNLAYDTLTQPNKVILKSTKLAVTTKTRTEDIKYEVNGKDIYEDIVQGKINEKSVGDMFGKVSVDAKVQGLRSASIENNTERAHTRAKSIVDAFKKAHEYWKTAKENGIENIGIKELVCTAAILVADMIEPWEDTSKYPTVNEAIDRTRDNLKDSLTLIQHEDGIIQLDQREVETILYNAPYSDEERALAAISLVESVGSEESIEIDDGRGR